MIKIKGFLKRNYVYIITITLFTFWIGALILIDYRTKELHDQKEEYIQELEEKVENYEKELTDIALNEGLLDDINLELQIKQNELDNLNQQIEEAKKELEGLKNE